MKKTILFCIMLSLVSIQLGAQSNEQKKNNLNNEKEVYELFKRHGEEISEHTLDKMADLKTLVGRMICLRPDYWNGADSKLMILRSKNASVLNTTLTERLEFGKNDVLVVVKVKKDEMTVSRGEEKMVIENNHYKNFLLIEDKERLLSSFLLQEEQMRQEAAQRVKEREEREAREKAAAANKARQENLKQYYESLEKMPKAIEGPIAVDVTERAYKGNIPYWKHLMSKGSSKLDTYRDEKFLISPQRFKIVYERYRKKIESGSSDLNAQQIASLSELQKDTFGIFRWNEYIDLRTGDVFKDNNLVTGLWESVHYLDIVSALPKVTYDGTESLEEALREDNHLYMESVIESLIGERVFMLDSLKYDYIIAIEETPGRGDKTILYLKDRGAIEYWKNKCISVKWYEQLQKLVGKKAILSDVLYYSQYDRIWKENLYSKETCIINKFEVKDKEFHMIVSYNNGQTEKVNALDYCDLLAYPINIAEEWESKDLTNCSRLDRRSYLSYDAVLATTPCKPADVKKREAENQARRQAASAKMDKLRQHKLIGTSLGEFLSDWPQARLLNTTSSNGITIKVYRVYDYQVVFRNGWCVSQSN